MVEHWQPPLPAFSQYIDQLPVSRSIVGIEKNIVNIIRDKMMRLMEVTFVNTSRIRDKVDKKRIRQPIDLDADYWSVLQSGIHTDVGVVTGSCSPDPEATCEDIRVQFSVDLPHQYTHKISKFPVRLEYTWMGSQKHQHERVYLYERQGANGRVANEHRIFTSTIHPDGHKDEDVDLFVQSIFGKNIVEFSNKKLRIGIPDGVLVYPPMSIDVRKNLLKIWAQTHPQRWHRLYNPVKTGPSDIIHPNDIQQWYYEGSFKVEDVETMPKDVVQNMLEISKIGLGGIYESLEYCFARKGFY